jgi:diphthine-ammonia ligase
VDERIHISGQIGLVPATLALPSPPSLPTETALSFQNTQRIINALSSNAGNTWSGYIQTAIYWLDNPQNIAFVRTAEDVHEKTVNHPALFVSVKALPKGALVEKQVLAHTGRCYVLDEDEDPVMEIHQPGYESGIQTSLPRAQAPSTY